MAEPKSMDMRVKPVEPVKPVQAVEQTLYEIRRKIYPRAVTGNFATARWALVFLTQAIFYGLPWLSWNDRQAVLFDLASRKFYIFGLVFWPQDIVYLTVILILSAYSLFLFTAVAGRLWCGYACPQTVYTEIFLWIERKVEGDRVARMKLDKAPLSAGKVGRKVLKHGLWIALALWTGFTFVGYFTPIQTLLKDVAAFGTGPWETFWMLFYGFATYGNAGWMREQVCKYMCPYARFQGVMFDPDTLVITYDKERGEPRGARSKSADPAKLNLGSCVDCNICVQVCPTGIDIRNGLQYECIGCAACIDGCNQVMDKMGYERGLIRYSTENAVKQHLDKGGIVRRVLRPRVLLYTGILFIVLVAAVVTLAHRVPVKVDVIRDRVPMSASAGDGRVENVYRLQIMNTDETPRRFTIAVTGMPDIQLEARENPVDLPGARSRMIPVRVLARPGTDAHGSQNIVFTVTGEAPGTEPVVITEHARFVVP